MMGGWVEALWAELEMLSAEERIVIAGRYIVYITRNLLPELGNLRREAVLEVLDRPDWDATRLAETIGSRRTTIARLAEEGRARRRRHEADTPA